MRTHENTVWKPTSGAGDNKSSTVQITFHSLDSLVWEFVTEYYIEDVTFADLYFFFCKCQILAYKCTHSTSGKGSSARRGEKYHNAKGTPPGWVLL